MVDNGQLAVSLLDLRLICILLHAEDLVVILALALLELELGTADLFCNSRLFWVGLVDSLELLYGSFPIA